MPSSFSRASPCLPSLGTRPQVFSAASDISTAGVGVYAYTETSSNVTVNGVTFTGLGSGFNSGGPSPNLTTGIFSGQYNGYGQGSVSAYNGLLGQAIYQDSPTARAR